MEKRSLDLIASYKECIEKNEQLISDLWKKMRNEKTTEEQKEELYANVRELDEINRMLEREMKIIKAENINVGDGISVCPYTDWHAYTVIERKDTAKGFKLICQKDEAVRVDDNGMSDCQDYEFKRNLNGRTIEVRWNPKKRWFTSKDYMHVAMGRHEYYDYTF